MDMKCEQIANRSKWYIQARYFSMCRFNCIYIVVDMRVSLPYFYLGLGENSFDQLNMTTVALFFTG